MGVLRVHVVCLSLSVLLLAEDLQLQEELLLLQQPGVGRVHGRRGLLGLLVGRDVLVVLELLHLGLHVLGLLVPVLVRRLGLQFGKRRWIKLGSNRTFISCIF